MRSGGSAREVCLDSLGLVTSRQRLLWAERTSRELFSQRRDAALGVAVSRSRTAPAEAAERFLADAGSRLRPRTLLAYRRHAERIRDWLERAGVASVEQVTPESLWRLREAILLRGGASVTRQNACKRASVLLSWWRRAGLLPLCSQDVIADATAAPPVPRPLPVVLSREQIEALLAAALEDHWQRAAAVMLGLLTGVRPGELVTMLWSQVDLPAQCLRIGTESKTGRGRVVDLAVSPLALELLEVMPRRAPRVLPWCRTSQVMYGWAVRWRKRPGVPPGWTWQHLRETCATHLVCAPGIYGGASAYMAARRLGHSVAVAERHYLGLVRVDPSARTLEDALGVREALASVVARARTHQS